ncbi:helix-turn-helix domain-containing protein [Anaerocolumna sp. AGMB13025]|uniref:helix-turn-helix domain-containing protein n=1 Tax=Anaerocolumna sp. AGMB13025 TaxID=3039116 RepID=UPI00241F228B|nr:helix-turn-helix domain-containing protein [Anaerocolumna sp. AGMB13025]WFR55395.1 helix-turn-helix domain-containing protein [Anaerocolumna sp. AGMB13025]
MNDRLKEIRKNLNLNQEDFGKRLGVGKTAISKLEKGENNLTDSMIKLISKEFNVDYIWLTTGKGEMFIEPDIDAMETIDRIMTGENKFHKDLFKTFASLDDEDLLALERIIDKFIEIKKADN